MAENPPSLRERRAQLTRDEILGAARRLFAERGYARTSVRDIAKAAGVSAQTVYDSVGSKQALVSSLNDLIDAEAGIAALARAAAESDDPREVAATNARITRSILEHCGDIIHALVTGAAAEPELAAVLAEGQRRHVEGAGRVVAVLRGLDALGPIDPDDAGRDPRCDHRHPVRPRPAGELRLVARSPRGLDGRRQPQAAPGSAQLKPVDLDDVADPRLDSPAAARLLEESIGCRPAGIGQPDLGPELRQQR